jgi:hypothetical protein
LFKPLQKQVDLQGFLAQGAGFNPMVTGIIDASVMVFHSSPSQRGPQLLGAVYQRFERQ